MQVVVEGGTAAERKKQKEKTINDLKEFDERRWWHFWTWEWINPVFRILNDSYMGENSNRVDTVFYPEQSVNIIEKKAQWRKAIEKANLN